MERRIHKSKLRLTEHPFRCRPFDTAANVDRQPQNIFWLCFKGGREMTLVHRIGFTAASLCIFGFGMETLGLAWSCFAHDDLVWIVWTPLGFLCTGARLMALRNIVFNWPARSPAR
jgi:hypothetical protein